MQLWQEGRTIYPDGIQRVFDIFIGKLPLELDQNDDGIIQTGKRRMQGEVAVFRERPLTF